MIRIKICKVADLLVTPTAFLTFLLMLPSSDFKVPVMRFYSTNHAIMTYYINVGLMYSVELSMIRTRTEASSKTLHYLVIGMLKVKRDRNKKKQNLAREISRVIIIIIVLIQSKDKNTYPKLQ